MAVGIGREYWGLAVPSGEWAWRLARIRIRRRVCDTKRTG